jgi:hypothetical protein
MNRFTEIDMSSVHAKVCQRMGGTIINKTKIRASSAEMKRPCGGVAGRYIL